MDGSESSRIDAVGELFEQYRLGRISRRTFVRGAVAVAGLVSVQALLAACAGEPGINQSFSMAPALRSGEPELTPQKLIYAGGQDAPTIDPSNRTDYSIEALITQLYDRLFRYERKWPLVVDPGLCKTFEGSADAQEWTFHLDERAKFHDGTPVTSDAVAYSFKRTLDLQLPRADLLLPIMNAQSISTPDNYTVKMTLTSPYAQLPKILDQPIMNPKVVQDNLGSDNGQTWLSSHEAGSGPFTIDSWNVGTAYDLAWHNGYWQGYPGKSHLSGFVWQIVRQDSSQRIGLISGEYDVADNLSSSDVAAINSNSDTHVAIGYGTLTCYTKLNNQQGPTADINFRKFLAYAFDYQGMIKALGGDVELLTGVVPDSTEFFDPSVGGYKTDLTKAREYLNKTQWPHGGVNLDYVMVTGLTQEQTVGEIWLAQLKKFNIGVNIVQKVWPDIVSSCQFPSDAAPMNCIFTGYNTPDQWYSSQWASAAWDRPTGGDFNSCTFTKNSQIDTLVSQVRSTTSNSEQKKLYGELQTLVHEETPDIPLFLSADLLGLNKRVKGYQYAGLISVDFWRLWIQD
jgi:peptide/nickel transport system substrate-binding protein